MLVKIHKATRYVVAICDSELFGKRYDDGDGQRQIDLTGQFFQGEEKSEKEVEEIIRDMKREDASFNIVGENSCRVAVKAKLVKANEKIVVANIPMVILLL